MRRVIDQNGAPGQLPLWTWIVPLLIFHLATRLVALMGAPSPVSIWYLSLPIAMTMIHWWGPRVLLGLYVNAVASAFLLGVDEPTTWLYRALPEVTAVFTSWLLFTRLFKGKCWLPDTANTVAWFLLGVLVPLIFTVTGLFNTENMELGLFTKRFMWVAWWAYIEDVFSTLAIASPLFIFSTPFLEERRWSLTVGARRPAWIPSKRTKPASFWELAALCSGVAALSATMPFEKYWFLYGVFSLWSALRYGIAVATTVNSAMVVLAFIIPMLFTENDPGTTRMFSGLVSVHPGMTLLYVISLITARSFSDIMNEMKERIQAEVALRKEKAFTDTALDAQQDVFLVFEPVSGKPIRWNEAFRAASGISDEEIQNTRIPHDWVQPKELDSVLKKMDALMTLQRGTLELTFLSRSGVQIPMEYVVSVMTEENSEQTSYIIAVGRNISERKRVEHERKELEAQLRQALKMEAIGTLAAGIANDFNNILSTIIGFSELVFDEVKQTPHLKSHMEHVLSAGDRAKSLVRQILAFSRQSEGTRTFFLPATVLRETIKLLRTSAPANIEIKEEILESASSVNADPTQFHQVLMNLYTNACHAMEDTGGRLTISLQRVLLSRDDLKNEPQIPPGDYVELAVTDTGTGISIDILDKIFEPYFTTKSIGRGTGLGLAIVHGIVKSSGGFIRIETEEGVGTEFQVYYPVSSDDESLSPSAATDTLPAGTEHILYVDDEADILAVSERILSKAGYKLTTSRSGVEALELFRQNPSAFDLVITDQAMPEMGGMELSKEISSIRPDLPILLYTGYATDVDRENLDQFGIHKVLVKPLRMNLLGAAVREVIDNFPRERESRPTESPLKPGL
ncbi:MAG: response regulator [Deltaproteobacteria bacterium]|nr:response regulator [Deltaproteobacteria bacterium]